MTTRRDEALTGRGSLGAPAQLLLDRVLIPAFESGAILPASGEVLHTLYTRDASLAFGMVWNAFTPSEWSTAAAGLASHIAAKQMGGAQGGRPSCPPDRIAAIFARRWPTYAAVSRVLGEEESQRYRAMIEAASEDPEVGSHVPDERHDSGWSAAQLAHTIAYLHDVVCAHLGDTAGMIWAASARKRSSSSNTSGSTKKLRF